MNSRYKDKLVGVYAPSSHGHTSVWVCQLAPLVTMARRYTLEEHRKMEGD